MNKKIIIAIVILCMLAGLITTMVLNTRIKETNNVESLLDVTYDYDGKFLIKYTSNNDEEIKELFNMEDHKIYSFGGDVDIIINNTKYSLEDALNQGLINEQDILEQVQNDTNNNLCQKMMIYDGGSTEYMYSDYTILKMNYMAYNGENDTNLIIGMPGTIASKYNNLK